MYLLLTHPLALALMIASVPFWVRLDTRAFAKDGSKDSLHELFHRQRGAWRVGSGVVIVSIGASGAGSWPLFWWSFAALSSLYLGYWVRTFNPQLNVARKLAYVPRFYVSPDPRAAYFPDRYVWKRALAQAPAGSTNERIQAVAGPLLQRLLNRVLLGSLLAYALLMGAGVALA
jgi:hypothetical protein